MKNRNGFLGSKLDSGAAALERPATRKWMVPGILCAAAVAWMLLVAPSAQAAAPSNDNFANATAFGSAPGQVIGTNVDATRQSGEPDNGDETVWWKWTAPDTGRYHLDTCETVPGWSSVIGVYTGTSVSQLAEHANSYVDSEGCPGSGRIVFFDAVAGTKYYFSAGSYYSNSESQNIRLNLRRTPLNDNFAAARPFFKRQGTVTGKNVEATRESGEPDNGAATVWWTWRAPRSGRYRLDTCKTIPGFSSVVGVYTGTNVAQLLEKANSYVDSDSCPGYGRIVFFDAVAGTTYHFSVGSYYSDDWARSIRLTLISQACLDARKGVKQATYRRDRAQEQFEAAQQNYRDAQGAAAKRKAKVRLDRAKVRLIVANRALTRAARSETVRCP